MSIIRSLSVRIGMEKESSLPKGLIRGHLCDTCMQRVTWW